MMMRENVPLASCTTLKVGGPARFVLECADEAGVAQALAFAEQRQLPWRMLGEGSNVLASDSGFPGVVLRISDRSVHIEEAEDSVLLTAGAGMAWDAFVSEAAARGLWGIENLAGIPGTIGASPVQNIGAYGMEVKDTIESVRVLDTKDGSILTMPSAECCFAYRDSRFKHDASLIILSVTFRLSRMGAPALAYKDLAAYQEENGSLGTPVAIGDAVRSIRARKFPDLSRHGTAGSFFKNPVIAADAYGSLKEAYPDLPGFPDASGVKVPLAFVLDHILGLRGHAEGNVSLYENQPLVLVTRAGATAEEVDAFASDVIARIFAKTGIRVEREVRDFPDA